MYKPQLRAQILFLSRTSSEINKPQFYTKYWNTKEMFATYKWKARQLFTENTDNLQTNSQKEAGETFHETFGCVRLERVNNWPNCIPPPKKKPA